MFTPWYELFLCIYILKSVFKLNLGSQPITLIKLTRPITSTQPPIPYKRGLPQTQMRPIHSPLVILRAILLLAIAI